MAVTSNQFKPNMTQEHLAAIKGFPVKAGETIYQHTFAVVGADGYLYNLTPTSAKGAKLVVIPFESITATANGSINSNGTGTNYVRCYISGEFEWTMTSITQAMLGQSLYASDNYTVDDITTGIKIGYLSTYMSPTKGKFMLNSTIAGETEYMQKVVATASVTHVVGDVFASIANPIGQDIMITDVIINIETVSTGAATIDVGIAANATTTSDTLIDGLDINAATGLFSPVGSGGTNGKLPRKMTSTQYITFDTSADTTGLVATAYIFYKLLK